MSGEEQNKSFYKETFEEIPVPQGLAEKVGRITVGEEKRQRTGVGSVIRKVAIAAAVLVALFVGSNGIAYAMTGETWVEKMILRRIINGTEYEIEAEKRELKNGETVYIGEAEIDLKDGEKFSIGGIDLKDGDIFQIVEPSWEGIYIDVAEGSTEIVSQNGRTYIWDGDTEVDITEDLEDDGIARGIYEADGIWKKYGVKKTDEYVSCSVEEISEYHVPYYKKLYQLPTPMPEQ